MIKAFGWIGSGLLAICGLPLAYNSVMNGHSEGISVLFMWMWLLGEIFTLSYSLILRSKDNKRAWPLLLNYSLNIIIVSTIMYYHYWPRVIY